MSAAAVGGDGGGSAAEAAAAAHGAPAADAAPAAHGPPAADAVTAHGTPAARTAPAQQTAPTTDPSPPILAVTDLAVARGGARALAGLTFALRPGEALILRGPNGIGKTTLLRTLAGLQPPVAGDIAVAADAIAYAAHADGLKPTLTVAENLRFWRSVFGGPPVAGALAAMDLGPLADRPARALSAGQKRRLGLARLLVSGRPLWALDEPTVSLDAGSVALFADAVRRHLAAGGAAVVATHIDLGLPEARTLDLGPFRADIGAPSAGRAASFDEAFA